MGEGRGHKHGFCNRNVVGLAKVPASDYRGSAYIITNLTTTLLPADKLR